MLMRRQFWYLENTFLFCPNLLPIISVQSMYVPLIGQMFGIRQKLLKQLL